MRLLKEHMITPQRVKHYQYPLILHISYPVHIPTIAESKRHGNLHHLARLHPFPLQYRDGFPSPQRPQTHLLPGTLAGVSHLPGSTHRKRRTTNNVHPPWLGKELRLPNVQAVAVAGGAALGNGCGPQVNGLLGGRGCLKQGLGGSGALQVDGLLSGHSLLGSGGSSSFSVQLDGLGGCGGGLGLGCLRSPCDQGNGLFCSPCLPGGLQWLKVILLQAKATTDKQQDREREDGNQHTSTHRWLQCLQLLLGPGIELLPLFHYFLDFIGLWGVAHGSFPCSGWSSAEGISASETTGDEGRSPFSVLRGGLPIGLAGCEAGC